MQAGELEGLLNAHPYLRVERPPLLWEPEADLEPFVRLLGEMIAAGLARNGGLLSQITLSVSNVTVDPDVSRTIPAGDFVVITIRSSGDWAPEMTWHADAARPLVTTAIGAAAFAAGAALGYSRVLARQEGSVTVFFPRIPR